ncbi:hypothetical protein AWZ03_004925 [Drosophila navojoa]|uniref:Uncharacterized protein n=1 Tax=Drosophila navojoa TaxID=7232 RepID=A0A484BIC2_DRONA|nr:hypothetical protein AWZ03_004925 [Drosophila navojoa]
MNGRSLAQLVNRSRLGRVFRAALASPSASASASATAKSSAVVAGQFSIYAHKYLSTECLSASADLLCTQPDKGVAAAAAAGAAAAGVGSV